MVDISITELSSLTKKTRPTLYKYLNSYNSNKLDEIPLSFIKLFEIMFSEQSTKRDVLKYCEDNFFKTNENQGMQDLEEYIKENNLNPIEILNMLKEKK